MEGVMLKKVGVVILSLFLANGCTSKKTENSYDMSESLFENGCLNLGAFYSNLGNLPEDGMIRAFTYDFSAADKEEDGSTPPSSRLRVLNRAAYFYSESRLSELRSSWAGATQDGCSAGALIDVYGNPTPFTVEEYQDRWIKVKLSDESTHRFDLVGERSMRITSEDFRGSQCIYHSPLRTTTEVVLRWGPSGELPQDEIVSSRYMRSLVQSVAEAPAALRTSVSDVTTDSLSLSASLLREMNTMEVSAHDQNDCPKKNKPPEVDPLPTPTPAPTPEPTPEPVDIPEETPEEPAPAPTPEV
jgi:hypothetical protein